MGNLEAELPGLQDQYVTDQAADSPIYYSAAKFNTTNV